jgi:hypothetical protein
VQPESYAVSIDDVRTRGSQEAKDNISGSVVYTNFASDDPVLSDAKSYAARLNGAANVIAAQVTVYNREEP